MTFPQYIQMKSPWLKAMIIVTMKTTTTMQNIKTGSINDVGLSMC